MSTAIKNALLRAASNELSNQPVVKRLFQELIDNIAGLGPGGGDVLWGNVFVVDALLGNDATAQPNSLKFTYETVQAALNAAAVAAAVSPTSVATVLVLPGFHLTLTGPIVWPNQSRISLQGLNFRTTLIIALGGIVGTISVPDFFAFISQIFVASAGPTDVEFDCSTAPSQSAGIFFDDVFIQNDVVLNNCAFVEVRDAECAGALTLIDCNRSDILRSKSGSVAVTGVNTTGVAFESAHVNGLTVGTLLAPINATVQSDSASETGDTFLFLSDAVGPGNYDVRVHGKLFIFEMTLAGSTVGHDIDVGGSTWTRLKVSGYVDPAKFLVKAVGCNSPNQGVTIEANDNVDIDASGFSGEVRDNTFVTTGTAGIDRDWFSLGGSGTETETAPGVYTFDFSTIPAYPTGLGTTNFQVVITPGDIATGAGNLFFTSINTTTKLAVLGGNAGLGADIPVSLRFMRRL
jgi:hypothetical protein